MAYARFEQSLQDLFGNLRSGQSLQITVRRESDGGLASLFSDRAGATPIANPLTVTNGRVAFHVAGGAYKITPTGFADDERRYVPIGTAQEVDLDLLSAALLIREKLTGTRDYYVRTDGSDSNTGLANTAGGAFLTIQKAIDTVVQTLDCRGQAVTIHVADGTYTAGGVMNDPGVGMSQYGLIIEGNTSTPANVIISTTSANCFEASNGAHLRVGGFKLQTTTSGICLVAYSGALIDQGSALNFGACAGSHIEIGSGGVIFATLAYTISGSAVSHLHAGGEGSIVFGSQTITLTGTPAFSAYFAGLNKGSIAIGSVTFSGSATGKRYVCHYNGTLDMGSQARTFLPGNAIGTVDNDGVVICNDGDERDPQIAWKSFTPTITPGGGSYTSVSATGHYKLDGTRMFGEIDITFTNVTGATGSYFTATAPGSIAAINRKSLSGVCNIDTGKGGAGYIAAGSSVLAVFPEGGTMPTSGQHINIGFDYEVAPS